MIGQEYSFRKGVRRVRLGLEHLITVLMRAEIVYNLSPIAREVKGTKSIFEARKKLNKLGILTELDIEELLDKNPGISSKEIRELIFKRKEELKREALG